MNNSVFDKTIENTHLRKNIGLICNEKKCMKLAVKPQIKSFKIVNESTVLVDRVKLKNNNCTRESDVCELCSS